MGPAHDYRQMLRVELTSRRQRNRGYSMRAMARQVGLSPAFLSEVLNGKKTLGERRAVPVARRLNWPDEARRVFVAMVRFETATEADARQLLGQEVRELMRTPEAFAFLAPELFDVVAGWHHYAITELTLITNATADVTTIARRLGLTKREVVTALDRLQRVGLIENENGKWRKRHPNYSTKDIPSGALRKFHRQMLDKAKTALLVQPVSERTFSGMTMAIDPARIPEANDRIARFRRELMTFLEAGDPSAVYHLGIQLFRIDKEDSDEFVS